MRGYKSKIAVKKRIVQGLLVCFLVFFAISLQAVPTYAGAIGITDELDGLEGDGRYLGQDYRDNYKLDVEKLGMTDVAEKAFAAIANAIFSMISFVGFAAVAIFYYAMDFDMAALLSPFIETIQSTLKENVFTPIFQLVLIGAFIIAITRFARRDFVGIMEQFGKVLFILVLSVLVVRDSATFLSYATNITKGISVSILTGVSGSNVNGGTDEYAATAAGVLWVSLVHEPWKSLEFEGYDYSEEDVEFFLTEVDEDTREKKITEIREDDPGAFAKGNSGKRIGQEIIMFLTILVKCIVYVMVALLQLIFQIIAVFYVLMAPIILLMSLIPGYDFDLLGIWAKKILETQIGVLILTFVMGLMILLDTLLQQLSNTFGWFVVLILQIAACAGLYLFRNQIFGMLNTAQRGIRSPAMLKYKFRASGNPYEYMEHYRNHRERKSYLSNRNGVGQERLAESHIGIEEDTVTSQTHPTYIVPAKTPQPINSNKAVQIETVTATTDLKTGNNQHVDTGIKSSSYYAPRDITDNWKDIWNSSVAVERPKTMERAKETDRKPILSQQMAVQRTETAQNAKESSSARNTSRREYKRQISFDMENRPVTVKTTPAGSDPEQPMTDRRIEKRPVTVHSTSDRPDPVLVGSVQEIEKPPVMASVASAGPDPVRPVTNQGIEKRPVTAHPASARLEPAPVRSVQEIEKRPVTVHTESSGSDPVQPVTNQGIEKRPVTAHPASARLEPVQMESGQGIEKRPGTVYPASSGAELAQPVTGQSIKKRPVTTHPAAAQPASIQTGFEQGAEKRPVTTHPVPARPDTAQPMASQGKVKRPVAARPSQIRLATFHSNIEQGSVERPIQELAIQKRQEAEHKGKNLQEKIEKEGQKEND